jgi:hypothetical protein
MECVSKERLRGGKTFEYEMPGNSKLVGLVLEHILEHINSQRKGIYIAVAASVHSLNTRTHTPPLSYHLYREQIS